MQTKSILRYIQFGTSLRFLQDLKMVQSIKIKGDGLVLSNIDSFLKYLDEFNLPVTKRASDELLKFRENVLDTKHSEEINSDECSQLSTIISDIRKTLVAEAEGNVAYIITDKRIDVNKLIYDPTSLLSPNIFEKLPRISQSDFVESCNCIAFDLPTAAAFHILRCTECTLKKFYLSVVKRGRIKGRLMWGPILDSLNTHPKLVNNALLGNLTNIKDSFRNPTDHPEKTYDIEEAQDLFNQCVDVINRMISSKKWNTKINIDEIE